MRRSQFQRILREVRAETLAQMARDGYYSVGPHLRHDPPIPYDVNCGGCEDFAMAVLSRLEQATGLAPGTLLRVSALPDGSEVEMFWLEELEELAEVDPPNHCILRFDGRFYDAERPEGCARVTELPIFTGRSRELALAEWALQESALGVAG
jgi:hypothetical protein